MLDLLHVTSHSMTLEWVRTSDPIPRDRHEIGLIRAYMAVNRQAGVSALIFSVLFDSATTPALTPLSHLTPRPPAAVLNSPFLATTLRNVLYLQKHMRLVRSNSI